MKSIIDCSFLCPMTEHWANIISNWEYEPPYNMYSFKGHPNGYLFDKTVWGTQQFCLVNKNAVIGQVACQFDGDDLWMGWSLEPILCGKGIGSYFVSKCVSEVRRIKNHKGRILLRVAASNKRAVKAYQKAGFQHIETIQDEVAYTNCIEEFFVMEL